MKYTYGVPLLIVIALLQSCVGLVVAGSAAGSTFVYLNGELETQEDASLDKIYSAAVRASDKMNFSIQEKSKDGLTGRIYAKGAQDKDIYINMKSLDDNQTEIRIRIGILGDEVMSKRIHKEIMKQM